MDKQQMLVAGQDVLRAFCDLNSLPVPEMKLCASQEWRFSVCAYYRPTYIAMCLAKCAAIGTAGMAWSFPGYVVDRTPYGAIAHELGHHADVERSVQKRAYFGDYSVKLRAASGEPKLTSYCENDAEWFAEMFRLFVTNSDLLRVLRQKTWTLLRADFKPVITAPWREVLQHAPERTVRAAESKVRATGASEGRPGRTGGELIPRQDQSSLRLPGI